MKHINKRRIAMRNAVIYVLVLVLGFIAGAFVAGHVLSNDMSSKALEGPVAEECAAYVAARNEVWGFDIEPPTDLEPKEIIPEIVTEPTDPPVTYFDVPLSEDLQDHLFDVCEGYDIDPAIVVAIIERESGYRDWLYGDSGESYGLMQIKYKYHADRMHSLGYSDLMDPYANIATGVDYLAEMIDYGYGIEFALMAYNGGPGYAYDMRAGGWVSDYARGVLSRADEINMSVGGG